MEPVIIAPPPPGKYDPAHCTVVHEICGARISAVHTTLRKLRAALIWFLAIFALPIIGAILAGYQSYIQAPLTYSTKIELNVLDDRVIKMEEQVRQLPTGVQMKEIVKEAIKEAKGP